MKKEPAAPVEKQDKAETAIPKERPELTAALVEKSVVKGKTTVKELVAELGPPNSVEKRPYHVPKKTPGFKMEIPPEMRAVETWNYWVVKGGFRALLVEFYIDEESVVVDYKVSDKELKPLE